MKGYTIPEPTLKHIVTSLNDFNQDLYGGNNIATEEMFQVKDILEQLAVILCEVWKKDALPTDLIQYCYMLFMSFADTSKFLELVCLERLRQNKLHPDTEHFMNNWFLIAMEEYGEMIREHNTISENRDKPSYKININLNKKADLFFTEVIQFCAVIVRYMELCQKHSETNETV